MEGAMRKGKPDVDTRWMFKARVGEKLSWGGLYRRSVRRCSPV